MLKSQKFKTVLFAATLAVLPGLSMAMGCNSLKHDTTAMSCAEGTMMDAETGTCVPITTG